MRAILRLMPPAARRDYAAEIVALSLRRRACVHGGLAVGRLWLRELVAAMAATWTAWTDAPPPGGSARSLLDGIRQDIRFAARETLRGSATPLLVVFTLAIGIGSVLAFGLGPTDLIRHSNFL